MSVVTPEKRREYNARYLSRHPENRKETQRKYRVRNAEKIRAWFKGQPRTESRRQYERAHYAINSEKIRRKQRAWKKANPAIVKVMRFNRRQRESGAHDVTSINLLTQIIEALPRMKCALCNRNMQKSDRTIDHVIPLSKGGSGHIANLQIVHGKCNCSKQAKLPHELDGQTQIAFVGNVAA